jgi:cation diffusion facilitator CzcD-associated flavoprotein CzcO
MGIQLKEKLGFTSFTIYEKESEVGGTWWVNTYPGCACDVAAPVYSFSFALNPSMLIRF